MTPRQAAAAKTTEPAEKPARRTRAVKPAPEVASDEAVEAVAPAKPRTRRAPVKTAAAAKPAKAAAVEVDVEPGDDFEAEPDATEIDAEVEEDVTVEDVVTNIEEVQFQRDGDDVVLTVGGKKRGLDDVDEGEFEPANAGPWVDRARTEPGMLHDGDAAVRAFTDRGWRWGGHWRTPLDYQHFEFD